MVTTPAATVPGVIAEAVAAGARAAVVVSAGLGQGPGSLLEKLRDIARPHGLRIVGPNCLGVMAPHVGLNASFAARSPLKGSVLASDALFPFRDGVDEAARAGVTAIIQPGGSLRDQESIEAADEHGITMIFTGERHFRH